MNVYNLNPQLFEMLGSLDGGAAAAGLPVPSRSLDSSGNAGNVATATGHVGGVAQGMANSGAALQE